MAGEDNHWVSIDVAAQALNVTTRQAYRLARKHKWRTATGQYPRQYLFANIVKTHQQRQGTPQ